MKEQNQRKLKLLVADPDLYIARVVAMSLRELKIENIHIVKTAAEVLDFLAEHTVHILITEWLTVTGENSDLVSYLRRDKNSPNRTLPIVLLTGRGERADVEAARNAGINEFVVKPFSTRTLYDRIEQLVDSPRAFVLSGNYVGPDRRRQRALEADETERRTIEPRQVRAHKAAAGELELNEIQPTLIMPDHMLKRAMELPAPLSTVITPDMLVAAQQVIDDMQEESIDWVREDLQNLEVALAGVMDEPKPILVEQMKDAALSIKSRAGTFGYPLVSEIARVLYLFLGSTYYSWRYAHNQVVAKHIEALKVALAHGNAHHSIGQELLTELEKLIARHQS